MTDHDEVPPDVVEMYPSEKRSFVKLLISATNTAVKLASKTGGVSLKVGKAILSSPERLKTMQETGEYLRDIREVAGLTRQELSESLNLADQSFLTAVENGTATLSFELILRMAALIARHDPVPFIIRAVRTYNPEVWGVLEDWGLGRLPLHFEREREFINIFRRHDAARELSDEGFEKVLEFTRSSFEMALHFVEQSETGGKAGSSATGDEDDRDSPDDMVD